MIFATEYTPPASTDDFLSVVFYLCGIVAAIAVAWRSFFPKEAKLIPQPLMISGAQRMATHEEVVQLRTEFEDFKKEQRKANEKIEEQIDRAIDSINDNGERRVLAIHERINKLVEQVGELRGEVRRQA